MSSEIWLLQNHHFLKDILFFWGVIYIMMEQCSGYDVLLINQSGLQKNKVLVISDLGFPVLKV